MHTLLERSRDTLFILCLSTAVGCGAMTTTASSFITSGTEISTQETDFAPLQTPVRDANIHLWADAASDALWFNFYVSGTNFFTDGWGFAQAFDAMGDGARRTAGARHLDQLLQLTARYGSINYSPYSPTFYDDHAWMALALTRAASTLRQTPALAAAATAARAGARAEYAIIRGGLDANTHRIFWRADHANWVTASNATSSRVACELYETDGRDPNDLAFAAQVYAAWRPVALNANSGQVNDGLDTKGSLSQAQFTYNYGTMIAAALCLHRNTGQGAYLNDAALMGNFALGQFVQTNLGLAVLTEGGCDNGCGGDGALFKGIGSRYLAELLRHDPQAAALLSTVNGSASAIFNSSRSGSQLGSVWQRVPFSQDSQGAQTSGTMGLEAAGAEAFGIPHSPAPALFYEAENQNLTNVGHEALYGSYTGQGYVAGWGSNGGKVSFNILTPYTGMHRLAFRVASTAAGARVIQVGSSKTMLSIPASGGFNAFVNTTADVSLSAGLNAVDVLFDSTQGSSQYVNLDSLTVFPLFSANQGTTPLAMAEPEMPKDGVGVTQNIDFSWTAVSGVTGYDVVVDDVKVAELSADTNALNLPASDVGAGAHRWYVVAKNGDLGTAGFQASFNAVVDTLALPKTVTLADTDAGLALTWGTLDIANDVRIDVRADGKLLCGRVQAPSCVIPGLKAADLANKHVVLRTFNAAGQIEATLGAQGALSAVASVSDDT